MTSRKYYSIRNSKDPKAGRLDLPTMLELFHDMYSRFENQGYFQECFGFDCVDGFITGKLANIEAEIRRMLRKSNIWPIHSKYGSYSEEDLFDVIEMSYDLVSLPVDGFNHSYGNCGMHYNTFDHKQGQEKFRTDLNELLADYKDGFELSKDGEILTAAEEGFAPLFVATIPTDDPENIESRVNAARVKFRRYRSSLNDRRDAIRDLADVLEFLRPKVKAILTSKDEDDLFNIVNNFGLRHHNSKQKTEYDPAIWYSWMFYFYLATIHAALRLIKKEEEKKGKIVHEVRTMPNPRRGNKG